MENNNELLTEMLNIAIGGLNENEACSYCIHYHDCIRCTSDDICCRGIWYGLQKTALSKLDKAS